MRHRSTVVVAIAAIQSIRMQGEPIATGIDPESFGIAVGHAVVADLNAAADAVRRHGLGNAAVHDVDDAADRA